MILLLEMTTHAQKKITKAESIFFYFQFLSFSVVEQEGGTPLGRHGTQVK